MELKLYNNQGKEEGTVTVSEAVFGAPAKDWTVSEVARMQLNNTRLGLAHTKTRGEVAFSNSKPWKQKGTGRARSGSSRSPVWVGGGTAFGPRKRDFSYRVPRKMHRAAIRSLLSDKAREGNVIVMKPLELEAPKTKTAVELLGNLGYAQSGKVKKSALFVFPEVADEKGAFITAQKSFSNIQKTQVVRLNSLNALELMRSEQVVIFEGALSQIEGRFA